MSMLPSSSVFTTTTFIPAITALAGFVPCADCGMRQTSRSLSPRDSWYGVNHEQPRVLALRSRVRLERHRREPGDLGQVPLEPA